MTSQYTRLVDSVDRISDIAHEVDNATENLARAANGNATSLIPAPLAYRILGELKSSTWNLHEVVTFMPHGLRNTLIAPGINVRDQHFDTGEARDPATQIDLASEHLEKVAALLEQLGEHLEAAQTSLNGQGFEEAPQ